MATSNYPSGLDDYSALPSSGQPISVGSHYFGPAITNIEAELGTDPAGSHSTVKDRIDQVDSAMGFKNRIIGGNFSTNPWQRGTSFTSVSNQYTADRFNAVEVSNGSINILKTADAPTVAESGVFTQHCLHADVSSTTSSINGPDNVIVRQRIEGYNVADLGFGQSGTRYFTLSFWHKHTKTGTHSVAFQNSGQDRSYIAEYTQSVSDTWEKAEITVQVDTSGTWDYENGVGIQVRFCMMTGSTYSSGILDSWQAGNYIGSSNQVNNLDSTDNNFKIALVQLEAGDKATRFETRSVGQELALCQRYYETLASGQTSSELYFGLGVSYKFDQIDWTIGYAVTKRTQPALISSSGSNYYRANLFTTTKTVSSVGATASKIGLNQITGYITDSGFGISEGSAWTMSIINSNAYIAVDAEL